MSLTISNTPESLWVDDEFEVTAELTDAPKNTDYFLKVALTLSTKTSYFGYTQKNDGSWHKYEEAFDNFFEINTGEEGSWSGKLKGKPDKEDKDFEGIGQYLVKVDRITEGGSHDWSDNSLPININAPTPTPTPEPTAKPTPEPTNTPKPTATSKPTPTPTKIIIPSATIGANPPIKIASDSGEILGEEASEAAIYPLSVIPSLTTIPTISAAGKNSALAKISLVLGMIFLFSAGVSLWYAKLR